MNGRQWIKWFFESLYVAVMLFSIALSICSNKLDIGHYMVIFLFNLIYAQVIKMVETKVKTSIIFRFEIYSLVLLFVIFIYFQDVDSYFAHVLLLAVNILILENWFSILDDKIYRSYKIINYLLLSVYIALGYGLSLLNEYLLNIYLAFSVIFIMLMPIGYVVKNRKRIINYMEYKKNIIAFLVVFWVVSALLYIQFGLLDSDRSAILIFIFISGFQYIVQNIFLTYHLKLNNISKVNVICYVIIGTVLLISRFYTIGLIGLILLNLFIFIDSNRYLNFKGKSIKRNYQLQIQQLKDESLSHREIANYLHDSILQDVIYLKRNIDEENILKDEISKVLADIILSIRTKMDNLAPTLRSDKTLYQNLNLNIEQIQRRYTDKSIVIDLFCDEEIYFEFPYDELIISIVRELVNNIYKHTNSNFVEIRVSTEKNSIFISALNDDGFLDQQKLFENNKFSGLSQICRTINLLKGNIRIQNENGVLISIVIPIEGGNIIENSINRRP